MRDEGNGANSTVNDSSVAEVEEPVENGNEITANELPQQSSSSDNAEENASVDGTPCEMPVPAVDVIYDAFGRPAPHVTGLVEPWCVSLATLLTSLGGATTTHTTPATPTTSGTATSTSQRTPSSADRGSVSERSGGDDSTTKKKRRMSGIFKKSDKIDKEHKRDTKKEEKEAKKECVTQLTRFFCS